MQLLNFNAEVIEIPIAAKEIMFLTSSLLDTFINPIVGIISNRVTCMLGKFSPYILWLATLFVISSVLGFASPVFGIT
jgi:glycoside/pentoside/hexuronide:cation symporter, GPH family